MSEPDSLWEGRPYCGCPDALTLRAAVDVARWPVRDIPYFIAAPDGWPGLTAAQVAEAFALGWQWWADVCDILPRRVASAAEALVRVECARIDGPMQTLAWSELADGTTRPKRQRFDAGEPWTVSESPGRLIDLARVACHEIGHVLGIPHIATGNLLAPIYSATVRKPQAGDVTEAVRRYGPAKPRPPVPPVPPVPPSPPPGPVAVITFPVPPVIAQLESMGYVVTMPTNP